MANDLEVIAEDEDLVDDDEEPTAEDEELTGSTAPDENIGRYDAILQRLGLPRESVVGQVQQAYLHAQLPVRASGASDWQPLGPRNLAGAVRTLVQDPQNLQVFYAGSAGGGLWKTETDGRSWFRLGTAVVSATITEITGPVCAVGVCSHDPQFVIVGTGEQRTGTFPGLGLFISPDGGTTMHLLVGALNNSSAQIPGAADHYGNVAVDPHDTRFNGTGPVSSAGTIVTRTDGKSFVGEFVAGDFVEANGQRRMVQAVTVSTLHVDRPFVLNLPAGTLHWRVTPRFWVGGNTGLWRFEPGIGWRQDLVVAAPPGTITATAASPTLINGDPNTRFQTTFRTNDTIRIQNPASPGPASQQFTRRALITAVAGNNRITIAPGFGALPAGTAYRREIQCDDIRAITDPTNANQTLLMAGMHQEGVFRGVFNRTTKAVAWTQAQLLRTNGAAIQSRQIARVRLSHFVRQAGQLHIYAVMENITATTRRSHPTHVYHSTDGGQNFTRRARPYTGGGEDNADYALDIAADPRNPQRVLVGELEVYFSANGGRTFRRVMDWTEYDNGTVHRQVGRRGNFEGGDFLSPRAQHADVHRVLFDNRNSTHVWVAHDAGICFTQSLPGGPNPVGNGPPLYLGWRLRSYGIQGAQFYDVTCSPYHQSMTAGGLQDNGVAVSYGGSTWYHIGGGDGGRVAFTNDPRRIYVSWQNGYARAIVAPTSNGARASMYNSPLPDVPAVPGDADVLRARWFDLRPGTNLEFHPLLEGHPSASDELLFGRTRRLRRSTTPQQNTPVFTDIAPQLPAGAAALTGTKGAHSPVCAAFVPRAPSTEFWFGTNHGNVYRRHNGTSFLRNPTWVNANPWVTDIAVVAASAAAPVGQVRVAVVTGQDTAPGEIWIADVSPGNNAVAWTSLRVGLSAAHALLTPPPGPITSVRFEPNDPTRLYISSLAGVYGCDQLPAWGAALPGPSFRWRAYNAGLPVGLVESLDITLSNTLRCATYGHGMWERPLNATAADVIPAVKLVIRNHIADDARTYPAGNRFVDDPRMTPGSVPDNLHSADIRVDAPRYDRRAIFEFGEALDAAEFDEVMRSESPIRGDRNVVYVHVQNRGHTAATNVAVHLYWAEASNNNTAPNLQGNFRMTFPADPPAGPWQRAAPFLTVGRLEPGEPHVARFDWTPPHATGSHLALLAITENVQDPANLTAGGMSDLVATLAAASRHVAVRIAPAVANPIFLRDGVDDAGVPGAVAWGGRSPDIVVLGAAPPANPHSDSTLNNLLDARRDDHVRAGNNWILVRAHNRTAVAARADVQVFQVARADLALPGNWASLGTVQTPQIPARSWRFTAPIQWNVPTSAPDTSYLLVAIARQVGAPVAPFPSHTEDVTDLRSFWQFLRTGISADRTAARALRKR